MKRPSDQQIEIAVEWLRYNDGEDGGEANACRTVADWLEAEACEHMLRKEARKAGVTTAALRRRLAERANRVRAA